MGSFTKLEERISAAVTKIEMLIEENTKMEEKIKELSKINAELLIDKKGLTQKLEDIEKDIKKKEKSAARISEKSQETSEKIKEKIESLLTKIEKFEQVAE